MKNLKQSFLYLLCLLFIGFVVSPTTAFASPPPTCDPLTEVYTDIGCFPADPAAFVSKFYGYGLGLIGGVAVLFIIYAGYIFMTSQGNPEQLRKAKAYVFYSIIGVLIAVFGYVFLRVVGGDILKIPGFG